MESPQNLKKRLKSVKNINQITKAMELVSATKMRKAQQFALDSRPYAFAAMGLLATVSLFDNKIFKPALLKKRKVKNILYVLIASDKGLAGSFNSSLIRKFEQFLKTENKDCNKLFIAIGEKTSAYLERKGLKVEKKFVNVGDFSTPEQARPIADFLSAGYLEKKWDKVVIFSTHFKSALKQEPLVRKLLPINLEDIQDTIKEITPEKGRFADLIKEQKIDFIPQENRNLEYIIEPSPEKVLTKLVSDLFFMNIYHLILEANASEHSARRMAMKTASDNASELSGELNLQYNKSRQDAITKELTEISAGAEALK